MQKKNHIFLPPFYVSSNNIKLHVPIGTNNKIPYRHIT